MLYLFLCFLGLDSRISYAIIASNLPRYNKIITHKVGLCKNIPRSFVHSHEFHFMESCIYIYIYIVYINNVHKQEVLYTYIMIHPI